MAEANPSQNPKPSPRLGSYLLVKALGSGGMSNVFRAVHEETGNVVAVKVLPRTLAKNVTLLQRFLREAKSAEALDHPNIVSIYDRGFDQGRHYLVLEYVEGRDMHDRVRLNGPLSENESIRFIREVAEGLRYAAGLGMVHRDVKPANLLMTPEGHAKIIDLGLALQIDDEDERVTRDGTTVGTVDYMAPEQARDSHQTSERSDIYSLGCTFYYLLTGSAPFPGGGLADKLSRHYKAPIPDVRSQRPELSESLSLLIRRMMEKKPEKRYTDYTQLIAALDTLSNSSTGSAQPVTLDALFADDDDDDDDDEIGLAPTESTISRGRGGAGDRPPSTTDQLLMAEIVDDDDDDGRPLSSLTRELPTRRKSTPSEVSLAELVGLDADDVSSERRQARRSSPSTPTRPISAHRLPSPAIDAILEEDEPVEGSADPARRSSGDELPLKTWIAAGVLVGLAIAIVGFGVMMLISFSKSTPPEIAIGSTDGGQPDVSLDLISPSAAPIRPGGNRAIRPTPPVKNSSLTATKPATLPAPPIEIVDGPPLPPPDEKPYPSEWVSRLFSPTGTTEIVQPDRPRVVVRRLAELNAEPHVTALAGGFSRAGEAVEIADFGPFFEDDCQVVGRSRLIRARPGYRPMIKIEATTNEVVQAQAAKFLLDGSKIENLVLEGLDIAIDLRDLPGHQNTLFLCKGAEVTLRDCTLTILNAAEPSRARFSVFRVEEGKKPNRLVLDRSTFRGPLRTLIDMTAARAEVVFDHSLIVGETGPLIALEFAEKANRSIFFHRSLIVSRGPVLEMSGRSAPVVVRALGSTFARLEGATSSALFVAKATIPGEPSAVLDWSGEDNAFVGWPSWLTVGPDASVRIPRLDAVHSAWPGSDATSRELATPWPSPMARDDAIPSDFVPYAPERAPSLLRMAVPHPYLRDLALGNLARLVTPQLSASLIPTIVTPLPSANLMPPPPPFVLPPPPPPQPNQKGPRPKVAPAAQAKAAPPVVPASIDLSFDVNAAPWGGDLGRFLTEKVVEGTSRVAVRVSGGGVHAMTPIRLRDGLSIAILGDSVEGSKIPMTTFIPKPESTGQAMIALHGGDLALANLAFSTEGTARPKHWVLVEDGLLAIKHCRFRDAAVAGPEAFPLIEFIASGTAPIAKRMGPFVSETDRPTARLKNCLIWTGGPALSARLGRGVVEMENCMVICGGPAVSLWPQKVRRDKFEVDLVMERCTIAFERTGIQLGPWQGEVGGPNRPWLVSTRSCVFPKTQKDATGALLVVDPEAMARGTLLWQSYADAYEVTRFLASTSPQPASSSPVDVKKQWIDLWGPQHARSDHGPGPGRNERVLTYKNKDRPKAGRVVPGSLELDPKAFKDLGVEFKNLPPVPKT